MGTVRVRPGVACVVSLDIAPVALSTGMAFDSDDPIVRRHPDLFQDDAAAEPPQRSTSVHVGDVEEATANPGQRRNR